MMTMMMLPSAQEANVRPIPPRIPLPRAPFDPPE
jgi:hypothetical protein